MRKSSHASEMIARIDSEWLPDMDVGLLDHRQKKRLYLGGVCPLARKSASCS